MSGQKGINFINDTRILNGPGVGFAESSEKKQPKPIVIERASDISI